MCVIIHKPQGINKPSRQTIETCFYNNPDGAGIAILKPESSRVEIHKGFMDLKSYLEFTDAIVRKEDMASYHFRIGTSGGNTPENCHPFPVSHDVRDLKALSIKHRFAFIHNGVIGQGQGSLSDTQLYIRDSLSKRMLSPMDSELRTAIENETIGSRTLLIDGKKHLALMTGDWIEEDGLYYSNTSYKPRSYASWSSIDWQDLDDDYTLSPEDSLPCPECAKAGKLISSFHELFECPSCHTVYDFAGNIFLTQADAMMGDYYV